MLDTNVFVSGLISPKGPPADILKALRSKRFTLISSPPINEEIIEVLNRPYIRDRYGLGNSIFDVSFILWEIAELVVDLPDLRVCSDPDDDKFLAAAVGGKADLSMDRFPTLCVWCGFYTTSRFGIRNGVTELLDD